MINNFIPLYDLESLNENQKQDYIRSVCRHLNIPEDMNLVSLVYVDDGNGPSHLVAYLKRGGAEIVRNNLEIDILSLTNQMINGSIVFTAIAKSNKLNRTEVATGSKYIDGLKDRALDDSIMTAQTRSLRRVTLQFIGAGILDESEIDPSKTVKLSNTTLTHVIPQPQVPVTNQPGQDITQTTAHSTSQTDPIVEVIIYQDQDKLRQQAIDQLNAQAQIEPVKKARKPRGPNKPKVNFGLSEPAQTTNIPIAVPIESVPAPMQETVAVEKSAVLAVPPPAPTKPKLTRAEAEPYRQRLYSLTEVLENNGFSPLEGLSNPEKIRSLARVMFPGVTTMNDMEKCQWDRLLDILEAKLKTEGPKSVISYIEGTIGV